MKIHLSVAILSMFAIPGMAVYLDFDNGAPESVSESIVASTSSARQNVLEMESGAQIVLDVDVAQDSVFSFLAMSRGEEEACVSIGGQSVSIGNEWGQYTVELGASGTDSVVVDNSGISSVWIDDVYIGKRLETSTSDEVHIMSLKNSDEGLLVNSGEGQTGLFKHSAWSLSSSFESWSQTADGLQVKTGNVRSGNTTWAGMVVPLEAPLSDNVVFSYEVKRSTAVRDDYFEPILSFDNWASRTNILTSPISTKSTEYPVSDDGWLIVSNEVSVVGIQSSGRVFLGFEVSTGIGNSGNNVVIRNVSVTYKARATPQTICIADDGGKMKTEGFVYSDDGLIFVPISFTDDVDPDESIITVTVSRSCFDEKLTKTVEGSLDYSGKHWVSSGKLSESWDGRLLEAGEFVDIGVSVSYTSKLGLQDESPETNSLSFVVGGIGSVWINEVMPSAGKLELAAPVGRSIDGWQVLTEDGKAVKSGIKRNFNGENKAREIVDLFALDGCDFSGLSGNAVLQLVNSAGIVEHVVSINGFSSKADSYAAYGTLPYSPDDWSGAADHFQELGLCEVASPNSLNDGQFISLPSKASILLRSKDTDSVSAEIEVKFSDDVQFSTNSCVISGNAEIEESETGDNATWFRAFDFVDTPLTGNNASDILEGFSARASAFGYAGLAAHEPIKLDLVDSVVITTNVVSFELMPSIGVEDFSRNFLVGGWIATTTSASLSPWAWNANGYAVANVASANRGSTMQLSPVSKIDRCIDGVLRSWVKYSVRTQNLQPTRLSDDMTFVFTDPETKETVRFNSVSNRYDSSIAPKNEWVKTTQVLNLDATRNSADSFNEKFDLTFEVVAHIGKSGAALNFDDLYLSFQDWAFVEGCAPVKEMPVAGQPYPAKWSLKVGEGGATGLKVELFGRRTRAGVVEEKSSIVLSVDAIDAGVYENPVVENGAVSVGENIDLYNSAGFEGKLQEEDVFEYWFKTTFDTNNGSLRDEYKTDCTYWPDNSAVDSSSGIWQAVGEYACKPVSVTAWGAQNAWVNEFCFGSASGESYVEFAGRVYGSDDPAGLVSANIIGYHADILDVSGTVVSTIPSISAAAAAPLDGARHDGLADNVGYVVVSGLTLPLKGGIRVYNADGAVCYAMCWGANVPGCDRIGSTDPVAGKSLSAIGTGNAANKTAWDSWVVADASSGALNVGQSAANSGPKSATLALAPAVDSIAVTMFATDIDKPVEYTLAWDSNGVGSGSSEWSSESTATASGLAQNTPYSFALSTRDSLGEHGESATASAWTLLDSWSASASGSDTNAISLSVSIDNLGAGDTAWWINGTDGASSGQVLRRDGNVAVTNADWTPNSPHAFALSARNGAGTTSVSTHDVVAYTKASAPGAAPVATADPNVGVFVTFDLQEDDFADALAGNPEDTEYALRAWLYRKGAANPDDPDVVDWDVSKSGAESGAAPGSGTWQTLAAWTNSFATAHWDCDITPTNIVFAFVARNHGAGKVESVSESFSEAHFELAVTTGGKAQRRDGSGRVDLADVRVVNPFGNDITGLSLEYSTDAGGSWSAATLLSATDGMTEYASGGKAAGIPVPSGTVALAAVWDALSDIGQFDSDDVALRWKADTANATLEDNPADAGSLDIRFALPSATSAVYAGTLSNGKAKKASTLAFEVKFDDDVSNLVATATVAGTARSGVTATPKPAGTSLSDTWTVSVPMTDADNALDSAEVVLTSLSGAIDDFGNEMLASDPAVSVSYDGKAPSVTLAGATTPFKASDAPWRVTATFSEPVSGVAAADLSLVNATATLVSGKDGDTVFEFDVSPLKDGQVSVSFKAGAAADAAGNGNTASSTLSRTYDTVAPVPTLALKSGTSPRNTNKFEVSVSFTESVTGLGVSDFTLSSGASATLSGSGKSYTLTVTCPNNSAQTGAATTVTLAAGKCQDAAGNLNAAFGQTISVVYDKVKPTVALSSNTPANFNAAQSPLVVTAAFAEPVSGVAAADLSLVNATATLVSGKDGDTVFTFRVMPSGDGKVTVSFKANAATDAAGNANSASATLSRTYDGTAPQVVSITVDPDGYFNRRDEEENGTSQTAKKIVANYGDGPIVSATVVFSEAMDPDSLEGVLSLGNADYPGSGTSALDAPDDVDGDGKTFLWLVHPLAEGPVSIEVSTKATDLAGNPLADSVRYGGRLVYDNTAPVVTLSGTPASPTSAGDFAIGVSAADGNSAAGLALSWSVVRGGIEVASGAGTGTGPWTARHSGLGEGSYTFTATVADAAGNVGTASCAWRVTRSAPSAGITPAAALVKGDTATFTVAFSEAVFGLEAADFEVLGGDIAGALASVAAAPPSVAYEVRVRAARPGTTVGLALPAHSATNALGMGNAAAAAATCEVDYTPPAVGTLAVSPARASTGAEVACFFEVEDANLASVSVAGQTATALPGAGNGVARYAFTATATSSASFVITATDAVGNSTVTNAPSPLVIDDAAPELAWSGVPATGGASAASAQFAATLERVVDDDPDVTFRWAVVSCEDADTLPDGWGESDEDWSAWSGAVEGSVVAQNGLESGADYAFVVQARDSAGNEVTESCFWTQAGSADPASDGGAGISAPLISGDIAAFEVSWDDPAVAFDAGSFFLRTNALSVVSVETEPGPFDSATGKTNVTVFVTTSGRLPGAAVELVVPAGALGSEDDSSQTAAFEVPVLTYLGRSFDDPNVVEWKLDGVSARPAATAFQVVDPSTNAVGTVADKNKPAAAVRAVSGSAASGWTISVDDHAYDYVGPDGIDVKSHSSNSDAGNTNWMDHVFVNWRLAYGAATSAAPAEVNLALPAFGGNLAVNTEPDVDMAYDREWGATTTKFDFTLDWSKSTADSISRNRNRANIWAFWGDTGDRKSVIWTNAPVAIRSMQWTLAPGSSLDRVQAFPEPVSDDSTICDLSGDLSAVRLDFTTSSVLRADKGQIRGMENAAKSVRFSNFAVMGAPARFACETPVPRLALADTVRDADGQGVVRVRVASETAFCAVDESKIAVSWGEGLSGPDSFSVSNRTEKGFELVFEDVCGEGLLSVALEEGALVNAGTAAAFVAESPETSATFGIDVAAPVVASIAGSDPAGDGNPVFVLTLGEDASGVELGGFSVAVAGASGAPAGEAAVSFFARSGNVVTVGVHASSWEPGSTLALSWEGTLRDASGNESSASVSASVALPADPATETAASITVSAGEGGTVSPSGTRWFAADSAEQSLDVVAAPNAGYEFSGWTLSGATAGDASAASTTIAAVSAGASATATFSPAGNVAVAVSCGANGSASWTGTGHVVKGGSTNVIFTAADGYRIASVTTNGVAVFGAAGQGSRLVSLSGLQAAVTVRATFEAVPAVSIAVADGDAAVQTEPVAWNGDWSRTFTAPDGKEIDSIAVDGVAVPAAFGASSYTLQLFGVVADTVVVAVYRDIVVPPPPPDEGFAIGNLRWTSFDPKTGVATFVATTEGDAPAAVSALWVVSPGAAATNKAEGCALSQGKDGSWTVSGVPTNLDALFLVGLEIEDEAE